MEFTTAGHRARRNDRLRAREHGRAVVLDQRAKACGLLPVGDAGGGWDVHRGEVDGHKVATLIGPGLCGKTNLCGWCAGPIRQERAGEIDDLARRFLAAGGTVWLVTATTSPVDGEDPVQARERLMGTYKAWSSGGVRARWNERYALVASHRTLEVMVTPAPLRAHWHTHSLLFLGAMSAEDEARALIGLRRLWIDAAEDRGAAVHWKHGFDVVPVALQEDGTIGGVGAYVTKSVGAEACRGDMKRSRGDSFAPFELVTMFAETGDLAYRHAFHAYEQAVQGVGPMRWSRCARANIEAWCNSGAVAPVVEVETDETVSAPDDAEEVPAGAVEDSRPVAHVDTHAARWFASQRLFVAVHLVVEAAPTDGQVPEYLRALARARGAPVHVVDGIGLPLAVAA